MDLLLRLGLVSLAKDDIPHFVGFVQLLVLIGFRV